MTPPPLDIHQHQQDGSRIATVPGNKGVAFRPPAQLREQQEEEAPGLAGTGATNNLQAFRETIKPALQKKEGTYISPFHFPGNAKNTPAQLMKLAYASNGVFRNEEKKEGEKDEYNYMDTADRQIINDWRKAQGQSTAHPPDLEIKEARAELKETKDAAPEIPAVVTMTQLMVWNGHIHQGGKYCGVVFGITVQDKSAKNIFGTKIIESVHMIGSSGWFAQDHERVQTREIAVDGNTVDFIGINSLLTAESALSTEDVPATEAKSTALTAEMDGTYSAFQYFNYIDSNKNRIPIRNSGFRLTKTIKDGVLTVERTPFESSSLGISYGGGGIWKKAINIKF